MIKIELTDMHEALVALDRYAGKHRERGEETGFNRGYSAGKEDAKSESPTKPVDLNALAYAFAQRDYGQGPGSGKIPAIKALRRAIPGLELGQAKDIVEGAYPRNYGGPKYEP